MSGLTRYYEWIDGKPKMNQREIATHEKIKYGTIKNWFRVYGHDPVKVRARLEEFRRQGCNKKAKLYPYRDGKRYTIKDIHKKHPDLSIATLQQRYRQKDEGDWEAIFAPRGKAGGNNRTNRIDRRHFAGLGPRRHPESIPDPTDYERRLWTGDAY